MKCISEGAALGLSAINRKSTSVMRNNSFIQNLLDVGFLAYDLYIESVAISGFLKEVLWLIRLCH